jgi:hypothetical protein
MKEVHRGHRCWGLGFEPVSPHTYTSYVIRSIFQYYSNKASIATKIRE